MGRRPNMALILYSTLNHAYVTSNVPPSHLPLHPNLHRHPYTKTGQTLHTSSLLKSHAEKKNCKQIANKLQTNLHKTYSFLFIKAPSGPWVQPYGTVATVRSI